MIRSRGEARRILFSSSLRLMGWAEADLYSASCWIFFSRICLCMLLSLGSQSAPGCGDPEMVTDIGGALEIVPHISAALHLFPVCFQ